LASRAVIESPLLPPIPLNSAVTLLEAISSKRIEKRKEWSSAESDLRSALTFVSKAFFAESLGMCSLGSEEVL